MSARARVCVSRTKLPAAWLTTHEHAFPPPGSYYGYCQKQEEGGPERRPSKLSSVFSGSGATNIVGNKTYLPDVEAEGN